MSRLDEVQFANEPPTIRGVNDRTYKKADVRTASFSRIFNRLQNENIIEMTHTLAECADALDAQQMTGKMFRRIVKAYAELANELLDFEGVY